MYKKNMFANEILVGKLEKFEQTLMGGTKNSFCAQMHLANIGPEQINRIYKTTSNNEEKSFLSIACKHEDISVVEYLIKTSQADVNINNGQALKIAFEKNNVELVNTLITHKATILNPNLLLLIAVGNRNLELVKLVLETPNIIIDKDTLGQCLLQSVDNKNPNITNYLIKKGVDVNYCDKLKDETATSLAIYKNQVKILNLLLANNANLNIARIGTALKKLKSENRTISNEILEILAKNGYDINKQIHIEVLDGDESFDFCQIARDPQKLQPIEKKKNTPSKVSILNSVKNILPTGFFR